MVPVESDQCLDVFYVGAQPPVLASSQLEQFSQVGVFQLKPPDFQLKLFEGRAAGQGPRFLFAPAMDYVNFQLI